MSGASQTTSQIESELLAEVSQELERRGTTIIPKGRRPEDDLLASLAVTALLACLAVLAGTGIAMSFVYVPTVEDANASTAWFQMGTLGKVIRATHYHASNLLILLGASYLGYLVWRGLFRKPNQWRWWRGALLLALAVGFSATGMLLPFDQLAVHGTHIRLGYLSEAPFLGELLGSVATGGDEIGNATLARTYAMHVIVLPVFTIILLRWLWRDSRTDGALGAQLGVAGAVTALVFAAGFLVYAPLGLQGNLSESFPEARPEWYALPLYELLKLTPPGAGHLIALFMPPLLALIVVVALPYIETAASKPPRFLKPLRIAMLATIVGLLVLGLVPIIEDMGDDEGYFKEYYAGDIMLVMGKRNDGLGHSAEAPPADTHNYALDMQRLHERLVGNYTDIVEADQRADWDKWANQGADASLKLLLAPDTAAQMKARAKLREACKSCHEQFEVEDVRLDPRPRFTPVADSNGDVPEQTTYFFDQDKLGDLQPRPLESRITQSTRRMMDQLKFRMRDLLIHAGIRNDDAPDASAEQNLVDLQRNIELVAGMYTDNEAEYFKEAKWDQWAEDMRTAANEMAKSADAADFGKKSAALGKTCEACHDGADDPLEPVEWRYTRMVVGD